MVRYVVMLFVALLMSLLLSIAVRSATGIALASEQTTHPVKEPIQIYTEYFPPYNYRYNQQMTGCSSRRVIQAFEQAGIPYQIIEMPWARALHSVKNNPNSFIYSINRTPEREQKLLWIAEIAQPKQVALIAKQRKDIRLNQISDFKHYRLGTSRSSSIEQHLIAQGVSPARMSRISSDQPNQVNFELLKHNRVDIWLSEYHVARYVIQSNGYTLHELFDVAFVFEGLSRSGYYLAANLATNKELAQQIGHAFADLKEKEQSQQTLADTNSCQPVE